MILRTDVSLPRNRQKTPKATRTLFQMRVEGSLVKSRITFSPFAPNYGFPGFAGPQKILKKRESNNPVRGRGSPFFQFLTSKL